MKTEHKQTTSLIHYYITRNASSINNQAVIFIHHAFGDHHAFDDQVEYFSKNYQVITIDLIGHGMSHGIKTKDKIHNTAEHIFEILEKENVDRVHIVGVSIGALLAQDFANKYPDKALSLSLLGGYDISNYDSSIEKVNRKSQMGFMLKAIFSIDSFSKANSKVSAYTISAQKKFYDMNMKFKRGSFAYMSTLNKIMNQSQSKHDFPILIMYGEHDNDLAISLAKKWAKETSNPNLVSFDNAGHCANMDQATLFNDTVYSFIKDF